MSNFVTYVLTRIDMLTKKCASQVLEAIDLSVSKDITDEHQLSDEIKIPNNETKAAMAELESGKGVSFDSVDALMTDLQAHD